MLETIALIYSTLFCNTTSTVYVYTYSNEKYGFIVRANGLKYFFVDDSPIREFLDVPKEFIKNLDIYKIEQEDSQVANLDTSLNPSIIDIYYLLLHTLEEQPKSRIYIHTTNDKLYGIVNINNELYYFDEDDEDMIRYEFSIEFVESCNIKDIEHITKHTQILFS